MRPSNIREMRELLERIVIDRCEPRSNDRPIDPCRSRLDSGAPAPSVIRSRRYARPVSTSTDALDTQQRLAHLEQRDERLIQLLDLLSQRTTAPAKSGRDWDAYAAVIASFIGILALAVAGYTAYVQRRQLRAQVWPHVQLYYSGVNLTFTASNWGTGPARITAMRVTVDGKPVKNWAEVERVAGFPEEGHMRRSSFSDAVVPAGKDFVLIQPGDSDVARTKFTELFPDHEHPISIIVCYCSVLDDCWVEATGNIHLSANTDSDECPIPDAERFKE